jgi:alginate O-acetyltransferase complex protein AlgI
MLFLDLWFWVFAIVAVPLYWLCPRRVKLYWLLTASAIFHYHFAGPAGMAPVIVLAILTYGTALWTPRRSGPSLYSLTALLVVGALLFYKYSTFLLHSGASAVESMGLHVPPGLVAWRSPAIPLGISFFTFEFVHYLYEVRVHGHAPIRHPVRFAVFAIFFPTLAAGPIKRFPDFVPQLEALSNPDRALLASGAKRIILGLFKKVCIADLLVEYISTAEHVVDYSAPVVIALAVLQGFRIYYDFGGYTDIAVGLAQLLNLRVPENFNRPYWSTSLQEFWRRWHISLSSWIRDYIYIPLGGNRAHRAFNLLAAMVICGLWHGAAWNFAAWGLYHGLGLGLEAALRGARPSWFGDGRLRRAVGWGITYAFVCYGWLIFFYPLETVARMTRALLTWN